MSQNAQQMDMSVALNSEWFDHNQQVYIDKQEVLECYQNMRRMVERELRGVRRLLDIGNGGFFNYDTSLVEHVTAVDLFLRDGPGPRPNVAFRRGSFLDLPCPSEAFDCMLQQNVLHHVVGRSLRENHANLQQCLREMYRCLRPGGKAVVIESTVGRVFYAFEALAFKPLTWIKRGGHPVTFQFTPQQIMEAARRCGFHIDEYAMVPRGAFVIHYGYVWPCCLTPAKPIKLVLTR